MLLSSSRRLLPALLLWLALPCAGFAQVNQYETIGIEQGLSQGMIFDLCQTRDGFLWVATKDGLNRYDGYNFRVFTNSPFDPFSIASNSVSKLFEDARGLLWVGLNAKGVDVYEPRNGRFHHFPIAFIDSKIYNSTETTAIAEAPDGSIWFTQRSGGLWRIAIPADWQNGLPADTTSRSVQATPVPTPFERNFDNGASGESALDILCLSSGEMLVTTTYRQFAFNPKTLAFRPINEQLLGKPGGNFQFSTCGVHDPEGDRGSWFLCVNSPAHAPDLVRIRQGQRTAYTVPTTALLYRLARGKGGHTWLAMDEKVWDLAPDETPDLSRPDYELDQNAICFERDRAGNLWFGTDGYGLRKFNPTKHNFHAGAAGNSLGRIWANDGRYFAKKVFWIYNFDLQQGRLSEKPAFGGAPMRQVNLAFEPSGAAWLLGNVPEVPNGSLYYYSPGNFARPDKKYDFNVTALGEADPMLRARDGRLYIATGNWRLIRFDPAAEHFDYFDYGHLFGKQVDAVAPLSLAEDAAGAIWIGTQEGLVKCVPNAQKYDFQIIKTDPNKPDGLNNNIIACILPRPDGQIWLGTKGGGINILNEKTGRVRHLTIADGLLNNVVYGILPGNRTDEYWCSTNRGLAKIVERAQSGKLGQDFIITTFTAALGLQDNEFNTHSFYKTENGELLFGGINGLNRILPEELRADTTPPPVYIVGIEINNQKVDIRSSENLPNLELNHEQNNVSIEFAALDFTDPAKNRYRYRLVGLDQDWVETGNQRFAHFNHLAPGSYELRVQGSNGESAWRDAAPLLIVVNPPWYRSNLAYLVYLLLLAWAGWRAYQFQIQRVKEREQLAFEQRETERVKVLEQLKTNFFSNVTHEFRTPLTLILEPARQLLKNPKDPALLEKIRLIEKNGGQLLGLVNQLLDMAKLESGQMTLDLRRADLAETVRGVFERFLPLAEKRGVKLVLKNANIGRAQNASDVDASLEFEFDPNKVELVLNNLISNALKFTPEGGKVNVEWRIENGEWRMAPFSILHSQFSIKIEDSGIGIPPEALGKIFDRFYQVDGSHTRAGEGTGIGLALSKELAELMGGSISVESEVGKGSVFTLRLPASPPGPRSKLGEEEASLPTPFQKGERSLASPPPFLERGPGGEVPIALVVEDNPELRTFIKKSIGENWQVVEASDGEEGVKKAIELLPDLLISDLMMPRKDGYTLCDELKTNELTAHIPIILLTAKAAIEAKLKGLRTGADDYLTKPFNTEELLARMENLVVNRRRLRERFAQQTVGRTVGALEPSPEFLTAPDQAFLRKINLLIEQHLDDEALTAEDFAAQMFVSRMQLHRKLTALAGQSTTAYIRNYRLDRAMAMLKNREGNVFQVSGMVGFGNEKYFSTVFKERFGVSPSDV